MALAHAIAEHLPYLRRYARALCGTQASGDAYVGPVSKRSWRIPRCWAAIFRPGLGCTACSTRCGIRPMSPRVPLREPHRALASTGWKSA